MSNIASPLWTALESKPISSLSRLKGDDQVFHCDGDVATLAALTFFERSTFLRGAEIFSNFFYRVPSRFSFPLQLLEYERVNLL